MSLPQWRQFQFFTAVPVESAAAGALREGEGLKGDRNDRDDEEVTAGSGELDAFGYLKGDVTATVGGRGFVTFADVSGTLHLVDKNLGKTFSWRAYVGAGRITHLKQLKQRNILVSVVEEDSLIAGNDSTVSNAGNNVHIQFWNLEKTLSGLTRSTWSPVLTRPPTIVLPSIIRTVKVTQPHPLSAVAALESLTQVAVGFANGTIVLFRGDMVRDRSLKQRIYKDADEPITGLGFREQGKTTSLFVSTTSKIWVYDTTTNKDIKVLLDEQGCDLHCATMSEPNQEFVVARQEAIYFYSPDSRGQCFAYDGSKKSIAWYKQYLLIISPVPQVGPGNFSSPGLGRRMLGHPGKAPSQFATDDVRLSIFDTVSKFIAFSSTFAGGIKALACEWGCVIVIAGGGKVYRLEEVDCASKLDVLFKRNLYLLAVNLAHASGYDDAQIGDIFKKYGDHLYSKADYDSAMSQYLLTIGFLEPSYVIRKYLDAHRIRALTAYLQKLHEAGLANSDHTTLLLNCYTKLKDVARLDSFIRADEKEGGRTPTVLAAGETKQQQGAADGPVPWFDVETAIRVCRQAGYHAHALYLAKKYHQHVLYLKVQVEDVMDFVDALSYLRSLGSAEASVGVQRYGRQLLTHAPEETVDLLVDLCTGVDLSAGSSEGLGDKRGRSPGSPGPLALRPLVPLFIDLQPWLEIFLERLAKKRWGKSPGFPPPASADSGTTLGASFTVPRAGEITEEEERKELQERQFAWMTLLELYLSPESVDEKSDRKEDGSRLPRRDDPASRRRKALWILQDDSTPIDPSQALLLCHLARFEDGLMYIHEKTEMHADVVRGWMDRGDSAKVVEAVEKFGPTDPSLYTLALAFFNTALSAQSFGAEGEQQRLLHRVLDDIEARGILPPLQVIQALAGTAGGASATIGGVKDFISRRMEREKEAIKEDRQLIKSYREETEKKRREIEELKSSARVFQVTKCTTCNRPLDLPSVHFLCRHSFHQRCLPLESERECPRCASENRLVMELKRSQEDSAGRHDLFISQLEDAEDGFELIAEYFGKNVFTFARLVE